MRPLIGSLMAVALVAVGLGIVAQVPSGKAGDSPSELGTRAGVPARDTIRIGDNSVMSLRGDVPEVVVTAERPDWLMPEVVVSANRMSEVVVRASRSPVALSALPSSGFVN